MSRVLVVSGSPARASRTAAVLVEAARLLDSHLTPGAGGVWALDPTARTLVDTATTAFTASLTPVLTTCD